MMSAAFQHSQSYMAPEMLGENESTRRYLLDSGKHFVCHHSSGPHVDDKVVSSGVLVFFQHFRCHV